MRHRSIVLAVLIVTICVSAASAQMVPGVVAQQADSQAGMAQQASIPDDRRVLSLSIMDQDILKALDTLLRGTGRSYRVEEGVRVSGVVTISLQDVPLDNAVQLVLRNAGLQATRDNQTYIIRRMPVPAMQIAVPQQIFIPMAASTGTVDVKPTAGVTGRKFDILLDKANVLESMRQILEMAHQNYVIDAGLDAAWAGPLGPRISSRMRSIDFDEAIQALGKSANLVVAKVGSTYTVRPPDGAMPFVYTTGGTKTPTGKVQLRFDTNSGLVACAKCGYTLIPAWLYCPRCGSQASAPAPAVPGTK